MIGLPGHPFQEEYMKSLIELQKRQEIAKAEMEGHTRVVVGMATCGIASGAGPVKEALEKEIENKQLTGIRVKKTGCIGLCQYEPIVEVYEPGKPKVTYIRMTPERAAKVVDLHLAQGNIVEEYTLQSAEELK